MLLTFESSARPQTVPFTFRSQHVKTHWATVGVSWGQRNSQDDDVSRNTLKACYFSGSTKLSIACHLVITTSQGDQSISLASEQQSIWASRKHGSSCLL